MTVGERIKELRLKLGLSQVDFADKINVSKQTLYKYENNIITNIPSDKIEAAAALGGVSPAYLMGWDNLETVSRLITNELSRTQTQIMLYIQLFELYGYEIKLHADTVTMQTRKKKCYTFTRKDFMQMIQRCYKDINYNLERLIDEYSDTQVNSKSSENEIFLNAAHARTDIVSPEGTDTSDDDIMDDDNF